MTSNPPHRGSIAALICLPALSLGASQAEWFADDKPRYKEGTGNWS